MSQKDLDIELLTISEAAKILRISPTSMRRQQQERHITFYKVGGLIRFSKNDISEYLKKNRIEPIERKRW